MNLKLRPLRRDDFKIYYRLVSDPKIAKGARFRPAATKAAAQKLFRDDLQNTASYAVVMGGEMIGMLSLYATIGKGGAPNDSCLELAYMMSPGKQGRGYMTRAVDRLIKQLRRGSRVKKLVALVSQDNPASQKVLKDNHFNSYRSVLDMMSGREDLVYQLDLNHE